MREGGRRSEGVREGGRRSEKGGRKVVGEGFKAEKGYYSVFM